MNAMSNIEPVTFAQLRAAYETAKAAEDAYDAEHVDRFITVDEIGPERNAQIKAIPDEVWTESSRLQEIRFDAEDAVFGLPSPDAAGFALKVLIARGEGRENNGYDDQLEEEARRFSAIVQNPEFDVALAEYLRLRAIEDATPSGDTREEEERLEPGVQAAIAATDEAFATMMAIQVTDGPRAAAKLAALDRQYELSAGGVDRALLNQAIGEIATALKGDR